MTCRLWTLNNTKQSDSYIKSLSPLFIDSSSLAPFHEPWLRQVVLLLCLWFWDESQVWITGWRSDNQDVVQLMGAVTASTMLQCVFPSRRPCVVAQFRDRGSDKSFLNMTRAQSRLMMTHVGCFFFVCFFPTEVVEEECAPRVKFKGSRFFHEEKV